MNYLASAVGRGRFPSTKERLCFSEAYSSQLKLQSAVSRSACWLYNEISDPELFYQLTSISPACWLVNLVSTAGYWLASDIRSPGKKYWPSFSTNWLNFCFYWACALTDFYQLTYFFFSFASDRRSVHFVSTAPAHSVLPLRTLLTFSIIIDVQLFYATLQLRLCLFCVEWNNYALSMISDWLIATKVFLIVSGLASYIYTATIACLWIVFRILFRYVTLLYTWLLGEGWGVYVLWLVVKSRFATFSPA